MQKIETGGEGGKDASCDSFSYNLPILVWDIKVKLMLRLWPSFRGMPPDITRDAPKLQFLKRRC